MRRQHIAIAALITASLTLAATGALALSHVRAQQHNVVTAEQIDATCQTPDSPGCAALLNQIEPGT